jgi:predicted dithiol-disulfide oxidoreductase (DUF899 family)
LDGTLKYPAMRLPNESAEYRAARDRLLEAEGQLRSQAEAVAALRRELPPGGVVAQDYVFAGADGDVRLSELFGDRDTLAIYNFMFPRTLDDDMPCWSCSSILDSLDGAARHLAQLISLAVVAKAPLPRVLEYGEHCSELFTAPRPDGQGPRHVDSLWPIWGMLDVTPTGRPPEWEPRREYA